MENFKEVLVFIIYCITVDSTDIDLYMSMDSEIISYIILCLTISYGGNHMIFNQYKFML